MSGWALIIQEAFEGADITGLPGSAFEQMAGYLELLLQWNARLNLTSIRTPADMIRRHLTECAFLAQQLPRDLKNLMDYGSGAGFPGMVIAICRPDISVTLAEAHGKKASFLREVVRTLGVKCEVYEGRVEAMPGDRTFDAVSMRAVEKMELAIPVAVAHLKRYLVLLTTDALAAGYKARFIDLEWGVDVSLPDSEHAVIALAVPRGTKPVLVPRGTV